MSRILAIDYGKKRIGLSMTDPLRLTAQPFETWKHEKPQLFIESLNDLVKEMGIDTIVLGYPLNMNGSESDMSKAVKTLKEQMDETLNCEVQLWDERLTSKQAHKQLHEMNIKPSRNKGKVDQLASLLLLQNYMDFHANNPQKGGA